MSFYTKIRVPNRMSVRLSEPLARRLSLLNGRPAAETVTHLSELVQEANDAPAFEVMAELCRTLSDRNRLLIAAMLKRRPHLAGCEIQAATGLSQATVSHHMRALTDGGLVSAERTGKWVYYHLDPRFERLVP